MLNMLENTQDNFSLKGPMGENIQINKNIKIYAKENNIYKQLNISFF